MADTFHPNRPATDDRRRADEIHVHRYEKKQRAPGPLIGLGVLGLGLLVLWGYGRSREYAMTTCGETTVLFSTGTATLTRGDRDVLRDLAGCLKANASQSVRLEGRAEPTEASNDRGLAQHRADSIARELTALGVPESRFSVGTSAVCAKGNETCRSATAIPVR